MNQWRLSALFLTALAAAACEPAGLSDCCGITEISEAYGQTVVYLRIDHTKAAFPWLIRLGSAHLVTEEEHCTLQQAYRYSPSPRAVRVSA